MNVLIIGNIISLIGCTLMVAGGFIKEKQRILTVQCFQFGFQGIANLILGAYAGFISGAVSIVRNLVVSKRELNATLKFLFVAIQVVISIGTSGFVPTEMLPIIAAVMMTLFIDTKDEAIFKLAVIASCSCWLIYDALYLNIVGLTFDVFTIVSNIAGIIMIKKASTQVLA